jgi:hypothetical protein
MSDSPWPYPHPRPDARSGAAALPESRTTLSGNRPRGERAMRSRPRPQAGPEFRPAADENGRLLCIW